MRPNACIELIDESTRQMYARGGHRDSLTVCMYTKIYMRFVYTSPVELT